MTEMLHQGELHQEDASRQRIWLAAVPQLIQVLVFAAAAAAEMSAATTVCSTVLYKEDASRRRVWLAAVPQLFQVLLAAAAAAAAAASSDCRRACWPMQATPILACMWSHC